MLRGAWGCSVGPGDATWGPRKPHGAWGCPAPSWGCSWRGDDAGGAGMAQRRRGKERSQGPCVQRCCPPPRLAGWAPTSQHPSGGDAKPRGPQRGWHRWQWPGTGQGSHRATRATTATSGQERKVKVRGCCSGLAVAMATRTKPRLPLFGSVFWSSAPLLIVSLASSGDAPPSAPGAAPGGPAGWPGLVVPAGWAGGF